VTASDAEMRAAILRAFDVTEDDLAALEAETGYEAARAEANRERDEYLEWVLTQAIHFQGENDA
jgi:hypothetical protein